MQRPIQKLTVIWPLLTLSLLPTLGHAETVVQAWVQRYNGTGNGSDLATAVAADSGNNVIVTGSSIRSGGDYEYATIKYSSAGGPLWTNRYHAPGNGDDVAHALAVDGSDNVIVTGYATNGASGNDYATIKYSSAGLPLWTNLYNGPGNSRDIAYAVAVDGSNNVVVTGVSFGSEDYYEAATIKYSSAGVPFWTNRYTGMGNGAAAYAVAVDGSNSVIVAGSIAFNSVDSGYATIQYSSAGAPLWTNSYGHFTSARAVAVDGSNNVIVTGTESLGYATIKYSSPGVPLWTNRYTRQGNPSIDYAGAVAVDSTNNVIVTGYSYGSGDHYDYATIKYSSAGLPLWTNRYDGLGNGQNYAYAAAVDRSGNVIVTGYSGSDYGTIKYSSEGVPLWTNRYNGPGNGDDAAYAVAVDRSGNVIVTGYSTGSSGNYDFATVKYAPLQPPVMTGLLLTNGTFQMEVGDVWQPGTLVIEACTDLTSWLPIFTNTTPTNVVVYTDPDTTHHPGRFYRAYQYP